MIFNQKAWMPSCDLYDAFNANPILADCITRCIKDNCPSRPDLRVSEDWVLLYLTQWLYTYVCYIIKCATLSLDYCYFGVRQCIPTVVFPPTFVEHGDK